MNEIELQVRIKNMALRVVKMVEALPKNMSADVFGRQVLRSSTSAAANYRAACRAKSKPDFIYKLAIVEEESDETEFWLDMIVDSGLVKADKLTELQKEANEITKIISASHITAQKNRKK